jgi:HK97 family phage major capsid protein
MKVQVSARAFDELSNTIQELETLTSKPGNLTAKESARNSFLLAKLSMLKQGTDVGALRNFERDRLLKESGFQLPAQARTSKLSEEAQEEWRQWLRTGECKKTNLPPDHELRTVYSGVLAGTQSIFSSQESVGNAFTPTGFSDRSYDIQAQWDEIFSEYAANVVDTPNGQAFPVPSIDDTKNAATILAEAVQGTEVTIANFSQGRQLGAYKYGTGIIALSKEISVDSAFPWGDVLEKLFSVRMARGVGKHLINGNGVTQPTGLVTAVVASGASATIASGSSTNDGTANTGANSIGTADMAKCLHNIDRAYRRNAIFAMSDDTLLFFEEMVSKQGLPVVKYRQGLNDGAAYPTILGHRVICCPSMSDIAPSTNPVVCYAPEYFIVRRVPSSMYFQPFRQAPGLLEAGLVGMQLYGRWDSNLVGTQNASKVPASYIQCHS